MKLSSATFVLLSCVLSAHGLVSGPRPQGLSGRATLRESTKLFSSFAASSHQSVGNSVGLGMNGDVNSVTTSTDGAAVAAPEETYNINYGPGK